MKKLLSLMCFVLIFSFLLSACGTPQPAEEAAPAARKQLIIAMPSDIAVLDSQQADSTWYQNYLVSQPLVNFSLDMKAIVPDLALSYDISEDGKLMTWHLPADYTYSNGDPMDAQALMDSWNRYKTISPYSSDLAAIIDMKVIDATTLQVTYDAPPAYIWAVLTSDYGAPFDAAEALRVGDETFGQNAVGSGPFKLQEWVQNSSMLLVRNDKYKTNLPFVTNKGPVLLDSVLFRVIPEGLTRVSELEAGNIDIAVDIPSSELARFQNNPDVQVEYAPIPGGDNLYFNWHKEIFQDLNVRKGIAMALNRDEIVTATNGVVDPIYAFISPAQICYSQVSEDYAKSVYSYNLETAKQLMAEAGWTDSDGDGVLDKDGQPFEMTFAVNADSEVSTKAAVVIQSQLAALGVKITINEYAGQLLTETFNGGEYDMGLGGWSWPDPDILVYAAGLAGDNPVHYSNPAVDDLLDQARSLMDLTQRTAKYDELQKILIDDIAYVPLFATRTYYGISKAVKGLIFSPNFNGLIYLNDTTIGE